MMDLIRYIGDVNILLVVLDILFLIISFLFMNKRNVNTRGKDLFVIFYTLINLFMFSYFNGLFQGIFSLKYLSVRLYLVLILGSFSIFLYTFNRKLKLGYKLINYLYVVLVSIILVVNVYIYISNKLDIYNIMDIGNAVTLMNISCIIFFVYLVIISFIYIGYYLYDIKLNKNSNICSDNIRVKKEKKIKRERKEKKVKFNLSKKKKNKKEKGVLESNDNNNSNIDNKKDNSLDELFKYKAGDNFYINGVECSIIFCDSNKENIVKNYNILSQDINAKLVNGYTLNENIMIKDICNKLRVSNLGSIDINNLGLLNIINVDEYMFLKKILG